MNVILFTAVCLIGIIGISLLVILPAGIPGRRRTLDALERAEAGTAELSDLQLLVDGHSHKLFYMLRGYEERIETQCERLFVCLDVPAQDFGWGASSSLSEMVR